MELISILISSLALLVASASAAWAISASKSAKKDALAALEQAEGSNLLSEESNRIALQSKRVAEDSLSIGSEALELSRSNDARASDRSSVHWECDSDEPGVYRILNDGDDPAYYVSFRFAIDDEVRKEHRDQVNPGETIELHFDGAKREYRTELEEYRAAKRNSRRTGPYGLGIGPSALDYSYHRYIEKIEWQSAVGTPNIYEHSGIGVLGDLE